MMSPDKGSPFNSRWEQGLPQTWKKTQQYDMRLILGKISTEVVVQYLHLLYLLLFPCWEVDEEGGVVGSPEGCRACRGPRAPRRGGPPRSASTTPASRVWGNKRSKAGRGKGFQGIITLSTIFSGFPMVHLVMILGHNLKWKKFNGTWAFYAWLLEQVDVDHIILDRCQSGD